MRRWMLVVLLLGPITLGCSSKTSVSSGSGGSSGETPSAASIAGRTFNSTTPPPGQGGKADPPMVITFVDETSLSAEASCNTMSGSYEIVAGRLETPGGVASTKMFCDFAMEQEARLGALLDASPEIKVDGTTMTLISADDTAVFTEITEAEEEG